MKTCTAFAAVVAAAAATPALASIRITEYMYQGAGSGSAQNAEFFEITNLASVAIDLTGWSFDDDSRAPGTVSLSSLGTLAAGESAIVTEASAAAFRTRWNLSSSIKVLGGNTTNFGRADEINIFNASNVLVDRLTYDDQTGKGPRTNGRSANVLFADLGANNAALAVLSAAGDAYGSYTSVGTDIGNPGFYYSIPAPGSVALAALGGLVAARRRRN